MCFQKMFQLLSKSLALCTLLCLIVGCEEKPPDTTISQFDRPQDVALVCYDPQQLISTLPLSCCGIEPQGPSCGAASRSARLYAFVTQTTPGEVAVVDLEASQILDQDGRIPYNSFIPVGGQPSDIVAASDGKRVYTANYETGDISVIKTVDALRKNPVVTPAATIDLGAPAGRMVLNTIPSDDSDDYAFVTLPTVNRIAVVALNEAAAGGATSDQGDGGISEKSHCTNGCVLGYIDLDRISGLGYCPNETAEGDDTGEPESDGGLDAALPDEPVETDIHPFTPFAIVASPLNGQLYVGGLEQGCILEINSQALINEARSLSSPGQLSLNSVVNPSIDTKGFTVRAMSLEPELERFLYAITKEGSVFVVDLLSRTPLKVNGGEYLFDLNGRARAIELYRFDEGETLDVENSGRLPTHFKGSYAVVTTSRGELTVLNVDAEEIQKEYLKDEEIKVETVQFPPHSIRSSNDLALNSGKRATLQKPPQLYGDDNEIPESEAEMYAYFADAGTDGGDETECAEDGYIKHVDPNGFRFSCDPRVPKAEQWSLTWEGALGINGAAVLSTKEGNSAPSGKGEFAEYLFDETKNFCEQGLREGDLVVVKNPVLAEEYCKDNYAENEFYYVVERVVDYDKDDVFIRGSILKIAQSTESQPLPTVDCFRQAVSYEIRAGGQWVLYGSQSGHLRQGTYTDDGDGPKCQAGPLEAEGKTQRVTPGEPFANTYFAFTLLAGEEHPSPTLSLDAERDAGIEDETDTDNDENAIPTPSRYAYRFLVTGGFSPLSSFVGNNVTDIALGRDGQLILIDQAQNGLLLFDLLSAFSVVGQSVN